MTEVVSAISWQEIAAYDSCNLCGLQVWERRMIRELDDIARAIWNKPKKGDNEPKMIPASDSAGIRAMFERLAAQQKG